MTTIGADALVLLSDVDCLYTKPPSDPTAEPLEMIPVGADLSGLEFGASVVNGVGTGGAATKVSATRLASASGVGTLRHQRRSGDAGAGGEGRGNVVRAGAASA